MLSVWSLCPWKSEQEQTGLRKEGGEVIALSQGPGHWWELQGRWTKTRYNLPFHLNSLGGCPPQRLSGTPILSLSKEARALSLWLPTPAPKHTRSIETEMPLCRRCFL